MQAVRKFPGNLAVVPADIYINNGRTQAHTAWNRNLYLHVTVSIVYRYRLYPHSHNM
jgi:hypothetical protein